MGARPLRRCGRGLCVLRFGSRRTVEVAMKSLLSRSTVQLVLVITIFSGTSWAQDGAALYHQRCAVCHDASSSDRVPDRSAVQQMSSASIVKVLETGVMRMVAGSLAPTNATPSRNTSPGSLLTRKPRPQSLRRPACASRPQGAFPSTRTRLSGTVGELMDTTVASSRRPWQVYRPPMCPG